MATRAPDDEDVKPKVYFHIRNKQEVRLIEATGTDVVTPPRSTKFTYYKTECTYPQNNDGSTVNDERSICLPHVDEKLRNFLAAMKKESSVERILFQARFGRMFFSFPHRLHMDVVSTESLQQEHKTFLSKFPTSFNSQNFIQRYCDITTVTSQERYKIKFKQFADDGSLIQVGCHMEEQEYGTFKHIWTRVNIKSDETEHSWRKNLDIVRPGRHVDMRIVSHLQTPCCEEDDTAYEISERIANSMTRNPSGDLSMQVAAQDFCVVFIRKKITKTYTWIDPTNRNKSWTITELLVNNTQRMEDEYLKIRREGKHHPVTVRFNDQIKEIYFSGTTHATKPSDDPKIKVPTPEEFVADFMVFVEASFGVADLLEGGN